MTMSGPPITNHRTIDEPSPNTTDSSVMALEYDGDQASQDLEKQDESDVTIGVDPNIVTWDGPEDKENPQTWSFARKAFITAIWIYGNLATSIASSIWSSGVDSIREEFHVSSLVVALGVSLFLLGYAVAPPVWGPLSERLGRKRPMLLGMFLFTLFCIPVAVGKNLQTILVGRFFQGAFGSAPLSLAGGGMVDIWNPSQRGVAIVACIGAIFGSPILAPLIGNFVVASHLGWRWTHWISCIMGGSCVVLVLFCLPETLGVAILRSRAARLRKNGNPEARSAFDGPPQSAATIARTYFIRPFVLLASEPILVLITIYQSFIYGIVYLVFVSYPYAFRVVRGWSLGASALPFLSMFAGVILGGGVVILHTWTRSRDASRTGQHKIVPEQRLPMMFVGGCILPVGLFIFAWTSDPRIHWAAMVVGGGIPTGMGLYMVFAQCFNYMVDVYAPIANSAIAGNTFVRSFFGAGFSLFAATMYRDLGVAWATSTLGFISITLVPIPILFYKFGPRIRSWSKAAVSAA